MSCQPDVVGDPEGIDLLPPRAFLAREAEDNWTGPAGSPDNEVPVRVLFLPFPKSRQTFPTKPGGLPPSLQNSLSCTGDARRDVEEGGSESVCPALSSLLSAPASIVDVARIFSMLRPAPSQNFCRRLFNLDKTVSGCDRA
jgi:hypothetical protein